MLFLKLLLVLMIFLNGVSANELADKIILKNGKTVSLSINQVKTWGLTFTNGESCSYKVISIIETYKKDVVSKIEKLCPKIDISKSDLAYSLDFKNVTFKKLKKKENRITERFSIQLLSGFNSLRNTEIRFSIKPRSVNPFIFQITYFADLDFKERETDITNYINTSFGGGLSTTIEIIEASIFLNYLPINRSIDEALYLSSHVRTNISKVLFTTFSCNYFFTQKKMINNSKNMTFYFGLGINFYSKLL